MASATTQVVPVVSSLLVSSLLVLLLLVSSLLVLLLLVLLLVVGSAVDSSVPHPKNGISTKEIPDLARILKSVRRFIVNSVPSGLFCGKMSIMSDDDLEVNPRLRIPVWELVFTASRSAGPGGQHANKTSSKVTLHWSVRDTSALSDFQKSRVLKRLGARLTQDGVLQIHVEDTRSQHRNKEVARERLKMLLIDALKVQKRRRPTKPTKASKRRRVDNKKSRGSLKKLRQKPTKE